MIPNQSAPRIGQFCEALGISRAFFYELVASVSRLNQSAHSIDEFCEAHGISRAFFYELVASGRGPRLMKLGRRVLISQEAGADWRREMEERTAAQAQTLITADRADESCVECARVDQQPKRGPRQKHSRPAPPSDQSMREQLERRGQQRLIKDDQV